MNANNNSFDISKYQKKLGNDLVIFRNAHNIDVFFGKSGWTNHSRFTAKRTPKGIFINQQSGAKLPAHHFKQLLSEVNG